MSELLPSRQVAEIRTGLTDYLTTTFGLADEDVQSSLSSFMQDPESGVFRGPYARTRIPFRAAADGWRDALDWYEGHTPYGHQAQAFTRLSTFNLGTQPDGSVKEEPQPTLVVTGTGSGKTESFLYPIFDHVLRANAAGVTGTKALILYPMNALANDQARRIAEMIRGHEPLKGVRAAIYTGQGGRKRTRVTDEGLINDRYAIRDNPPDILLTNYKMLDQLLLRPDDQPVIQAMANGLQYLVLDEFHTYDGAQGTDVALLLRRLGLALKRLRPANRALSDAAALRPLGDVTPIATSATLGDDGDPAGMLSFAETVFGIPFSREDVVTETRQSARQWVSNARGNLAEPSEPAPVNNALVAAIAGIPDDIDHATAIELSAAVLDKLFPSTEGNPAPDWRSFSGQHLLSALAWHPISHLLASVAGAALSIDDLAEAILPRTLGATQTFEDRREEREKFFSRVLALFSHVRAVAGRDALSIDLHLWVRELTRVDRIAQVTPRFAWSDDGIADAFGEGDVTQRFPAIYCRHCGRSGWGIEMAAIGQDLVANDEAIRRNHANAQTRSKFRALISAPSEAEAQAAGVQVTQLTWFDPEQRQLLKDAPIDEDVFARSLPVLMFRDDDADEASRDDMCPACSRTDGIRFLGSAMATMLSVIVTTLFSDAELDHREKKALVFTDSVQDAAHRAGFIQSRAHVFALRNAIRSTMVEGESLTLEDVVARLLSQAGDSQSGRYLLLAPELVDRDEFAEFWRAETANEVAPNVRERVRQRLLFDVAMEFGLQSRVGRTLELTETVMARVDIDDALLVRCGRKALDSLGSGGFIDGLNPAQTDHAHVLRWVRGVVERMRDRGAIEHEWFQKYIEEDGRRYRVWTGRPRSVGMPAFPTGRDAPGYPRVGGAAPTGNDLQRTHLDVVTTSTSWYASWARKVLRVASAEGATVSRALFKELASAGALASQTIAGGSAIAYMIRPSRVVVSPVPRALPADEPISLVCDVCRSAVHGDHYVISAMATGPCTLVRCPGTLQPPPHTPEADANYYRRLYAEGNMKRVVAREHTGLLDDAERLRYEDGFKSSDADPSAPNVLVATPTLEMGIDIGDLSTVMLAGIPRSVASYLQRVGRAGRLTGNALSIATVTGRGDQLPRIGEPLSVINGSVRPPATFLNAQEILHRQFFAFVLDSRVGASEPAALAKDVMASTEPGSFLGDAVAITEAHCDQLVDTFASALGQAASNAPESLKAFATPVDGVGSSPLAVRARDAVQRWMKQVDGLYFRRKEITDKLISLQEAAELGIEDDAKSAYASAKLVHRLLGRQLSELQTEPWIAALERFGLLPNYTLLDDSVTLETGVSWIDPDTGDFQEAEYTYERAAALAITELAPDSYFYAQGLEIRIDAVDLGPGGESVREWAFCSACGHSRPHGEATQPDNCPRCGTQGMNDVAQRMRVVELETVSALARRDEASISDRADDRRRTFFSTQVAADLDPALIARRWFDSETRFGVTFARDVTIRWLNLGKQGVGGETKIIAGAERISPLFRVCDTCGQLDSQAGGNNRRDHRSWCARRLDPQEHTVAIALSRTLTTQGAFLRLPIQMTLGDTLAIPSLSAALLRGFRELLGGDPDHLRIVSTVEPVPGDVATANALLIHDSVPGGTGYLAELADPARTWELLNVAYEIVRDCDCRTEQRLACHRCLLPYANGQTSSVSRASAEQALAKLLRVNDDGIAQPFNVTDEDPGVVLDESVMEQLFRERFIERVTALGGHPKVRPTDAGPKVEVTFAGDAKIWTLRPQDSLGFTKPDFVLEQRGGQEPPIAIYTDGLKFHASVGINRVADDAHKRALVREAGYRVLAVTWDDLQDNAHGLGQWYERAQAEALAPRYNINLGNLDMLTHDPLTTLMQWMQNPAKQAADRAQLARALPLILADSRVTQINSGARSLAQLASSALRDEPTPGTPNGAWRGALGALGVAGTVDNKGMTNWALVLDDRPDAVASDDFAYSWRLWLHLSNLIGWRDDLSGVEITALSAVPQTTTIGPVDLVIPELTPEWAALTKHAGDEETALIHALFVAGVDSLPVLGLEAPNGAPIPLAWERARIATGWDFMDEDRDAIEADGWTILPPDASEIATALKATGKVN